MSKQTSWAQLSAHTQPRQQRLVGALIAAANTGGPDATAAALTLIDGTHATLSQALRWGAEQALQAGLGTQGQADAAYYAGVAHHCVRSGSPGELAAVLPSLRRRLNQLGLGDPADNVRALAAAATADAGERDPHAAATYAHAAALGPAGAILFGALHGVQALPLNALLTADVRHPGGLPALAALALDSQTIPNRPSPTPIVPVEVLPGVYAGNVTSVPLADDHWALIHLARTNEPGHPEGPPASHHGPRLHVHLIDRIDPRGNPHLVLLLSRLVEQVRAWQAEGRPVLVHCQAGQSRTGLLLRALALDETGHNPDAATALVGERWPHLWLRNTTFTRALETYAAEQRQPALLPTAPAVPPSGDDAQVSTLAPTETPELGMPAAHTRRRQ